MGDDVNNLALAGTLATAPSTAFAELRERPRFWFPLLILVVAAAGLVCWYYSIVDVEWFKDTVFGSNPKFQQMSEEKRALAFSMYTRKTLLLGSVVGAVILVPIFLVLQGLCLLVVAKVTKLPQGFKHWFALTCWSSLPVLLGSVVAAILLLLRDTPQVSPGVLQALSLNELLLHVPVDGPGYSLLGSLTIPGFLAWILMIIGVRTWSQRSWVFSALFILLPVVVIYGIWAFLAFR
jgi:hypothetical protein